MTQPEFDPRNLSAEEIGELWDNAPPAKHGGVFFAALLDAGQKIASPEDARLGEFIGTMMWVRETLQLVIDEGPDDGTLLLTEQAARLLTRAVEEYTRTSG